MLRPDATHAALQEEWTRAPTFVGGGLRLVRTDPPKDYEDDPQVRA